MCVTMLYSMLQLGVKQSYLRASTLTCTYWLTAIHDTLWTPVPSTLFRACRGPDGPCRY